MTITRSRFDDIRRYSVRDEEGHEDKRVGVGWADLDQHGRLVFARNGGIFAPDADSIRQDPPRELINLNSNKPEPIVAPDWAKRW